MATNLLGMTNRLIHGMRLSWNISYSPTGGKSIRKLKIRIAREQILAKSRVDNHRDNDTQECTCTETIGIIDIMSEQGGTRRDKYIYPEKKKRGTAIRTCTSPHGNDIYF